MEKVIQIKSRDRIMEVPLGAVDEPLKVRVARHMNAEVTDGGVGEARQVGMLVEIVGEDTREPYLSFEVSNNGK